MKVGKIRRTVGALLMAGMVLACGALQSQAAVSPHVNKGRCKDPVRIQKAVIVQTVRVRGSETDCINAWPSKYVSLNTAVTTDGHIWRFYSDYRKPIRIRKYQVVRLWIYDNHTKTKADDEIIGCSGKPATIVIR